MFVAGRAMSAWSSGLPTLVAILIALLPSIVLSGKYFISFCRFLTHTTDNYVPGKIYDQFHRLPSDLLRNGSRRRTIQDALNTTTLTKRAKTRNSVKL